MIGLNRLKRAIEDVSTGGMQTGDPKVKLKLCDAMRIEAEFNGVATERDTLKQQNAELAAQVEAMKNGIHHFNRTRGDLNPLFKAAFYSTPAQCLLEVKADAGRDGFIACLDYLGECDIEIGEHFEQDIHASDQYANKIRGG